MREKREDFKNRRTKEFLTELLEFIENEKSEGNENTISKEKVIAYLEEKEKELTDLISDKGSREFDRSTLPISGTVIEDEKVVLRVISPAEKEKYMKVSEQCAFSPTVFESTKDYLWESFLSNNAFVCSIYDTGSNDYVGYCSIKELDASDWEIAIELLEEYRNKGFGTAALTLFMGRVTEITGNRF